MKNWKQWHEENPIEKRIMKRVAVDGTTGCWVWLGAVEGNGYGCITSNWECRKVHKVMFELYKGSPNGFYVCHHCDNRRCCNPMHLFLGTYYDNMKDSMIKGRQPIVKGSGHHFAKLLDSDVVQIRRLYATGTIQSKLARRFSVDQSVISRIINRKRWTHI